MSTTPVPAKPDTDGGDQPAPGRRFAPERERERSAAVAAPRSGPPRQEAPPPYPPTDRTVEADLLLDIPQLAVDELTLELEASLMLNRIKLEAKGLDAGLYLKANFDDLAALRREDTSSHRGLRTGLRELLGTSHEPQPQPQAQALAAGDREDEPARDDDGSGGLKDRARHAATQGLKAAGLTAAGLAGGALLESRNKVTKKLPTPTRRRSPLDAVRKLLP